MPARRVERLAADFAIRGRRMVVRERPGDAAADAGACDTLCSPSPSPQPSPISTACDTGGCPM